MSKHAKALIAGTSAATLMFASAFADDTTEIENTQVNDNADVLSILRLDTGDAGNATLASAAMGNALEVDVNEPHDVSNDQTFSGSVRAESETTLVSLDGTAITSATAMGNAAVFDFESDADLTSTQTATDGSTVEAEATLNVNSYAMSSITASQAAAILPSTAARRSARPCSWMSTMPTS